MATSEEDLQQVGDNIFALIIGINEYVLDQYNNLTGAVADADAIEDCVLNRLGAPKENIVSLRNATRQQMLDGFAELEKITKRAEEPCIIVFYAGHGARAARPKGWENWALDEDQIEMLCPSDLGVEIQGEDGEVDYVEGVLDKHIGSLLSSLSEKRGNNITLILDCCCSAGINRDDFDTSYVARSIEAPPPLSRQSKKVLGPIETPKSTDENGLPTRDARVSTGFGGMFNRSHVLLAACRRDKKAYEKDGHGRFSSALLNFLNKKSFGEYTYNSMMHSLQMPAWQTPHCMGANADRPLFNPRGSRADPSYLPCQRITIDSKGNAIPEELRLNAGLAEGITLGEQFAIHARMAFEGDKKPNPRLGLMTAVVVNNTSSILQRLPKQPGLTNLPRVFYARKVDWRAHAPIVYCEDRDLIQAVCNADTGFFVTVRLVDDPAKASLVITCDGDNVYIDRNDPLINQYAPSRFPVTLKRDAPGEIQRVLAAWKHFDYHLNRKGQNEFSQVRMELHYLESINGDRNAENLKPTGKNLLATEPAQVEVTNEEDCCLGVTLHNDSDVPVYPYLFYFDPTNLTIHPWSLPAQGAGQGVVDPPLLPKSQLGIGYGNGGADPLEFFIEEPRTSDICFFRLFLSCSPANFSSIARTTPPFESLGYRNNADAEAEAKEAELEEQVTKESWGIKLATIIQTLTQ